MADLRFCAYQYQHLPLVALEQRWREAERAGFDVLWNCDKVVEPDRARHMMFDGPATLTLMAAATTRIRVGTLVTSVYFRHPVTSAKAAMTLDHLSGGRVEIALGVGDPSAGAAMAVVDEPVAERVARFAEFVELADLLLRQEVTDYQGRYYRCVGAETSPSPCSGRGPRSPSPRTGRRCCASPRDMRTDGVPGVVTACRPKTTSTASPPSAPGALTTCAHTSDAIPPLSGTRWSASPR
jgi:alkanesulfonate monooxygenase SsuD/methylene tetrahydromethanopterin reductase-like flavin-dependent oxidoreductase (luciferase family)